MVSLFQGLARAAGLLPGKDERSTLRVQTSLFIIASAKTFTAKADGQAHRRR